jgi:hypothetical protein
MSEAAPTAMKAALSRPVRDGSDEVEIWTLIAFSRGVSIGFLSAFAVFDWALLDGATTLTVLSSVTPFRLSPL